MTPPLILAYKYEKKIRNRGWHFCKEYWEKRANTQREKRNDPVRERERLEEIELYLGLPSIGPPIVGNTKAHQTNRLWAQVEVRPNSLIFLVCTIIITPFETVYKNSTIHKTVLTCGDVVHIRNKIIMGQWFQNSNCSRLRDLFFFV